MNRNKKRGLMIMQCKICKNEIIPEIIYKHKLPNISDLVRCSFCGISFVFPQPETETINEYYQGMYSHLKAFDSLKLEHAFKSMNYYLRFIKHKEVHNCNFLDLGGGLGYYSKAAQEIGLSVTLVELDKISVEFARENLKIKNIIEKHIETYLNEEQNRFDIVFARHVIEHTKNPDELISLIYSVLKKDGTLIIETDNNNGLELLFRPLSFIFYYKLYREKFIGVNIFNLFFKKPFAIDPPRHLFAFNMQNLSNLLKTNGLQPYFKIHYHTGHKIFWPNLPIPKISEFFIALKKFQFLKITNDLLEYFFYPLRLMLRIIGKSSGICIYAKKN
jgi:SAM-dependent methyltransferase